MGRNAVETVLGGVVLLVAAAFVWIAYDTAQIRSVKGYTVTAAFTKVGGLGKGADVRVAGIKVGTVTAVKLDPVTYDAMVDLSIEPSVMLPTDSEAVIASEGMLGGMYVRLLPGAAKEHISNGAAIARTRDHRSLEDQVGEIIFLATSPGEGDNAEGPESALPGID